jgi:ribosome-binding protein aMBF1 (putative translation factor)
MPSGRFSILVTLDDGVKMEFSNLDKTIRNVSKLYDKSNAATNDEDFWRKEFGRKLRRFIAEGGMNQEQLADKIGISRQMLSRYVRGTSTPSGFTLSRLAEILKCDIRDLTTFGYLDE